MSFQFLSCFIILQMMNSIECHIGSAQNLGKSEIDSYDLNAFYNSASRLQYTGEGDAFIKPVSKNVDILDRIVRRNEEGEIQLSSTTDVWYHKGFAYIGTFNEPCGTGNVSSKDTGIRIYDISNKNNIDEVGYIPSVPGSRTNDVKVITGTDGLGDILIYTNEVCSSKNSEQSNPFEGEGGFEIWNVDNPLQAVHLASVRIGEQNQLVKYFFPEEYIGLFDSVGVHNTVLFIRDGTTYVSIVAESIFDNFRIYNLHTLVQQAPYHNYKLINPMSVTSFGSEEIRDSGVSSISQCVNGPCSLSTLEAATVSKVNKDINLERVRLGIRYIFCLDSSNPCPPETNSPAANRFLHDIWVAPNTDDYADDLVLLFLWDSGMAILDLVGLDLKNPDKLYSVAIDSANGSLDGNVNSHSGEPFLYLDINGTERMGIIELNEDFSAWESTLATTVPTFDLGRWGSPLFKKRASVKVIAQILHNTMAMGMAQQGIAASLRFSAFYGTLLKKRDIEAAAAYSAASFGTGTMNNLYIAINARELFEAEAVNKEFESYAAMAAAGANLIALYEAAAAEIAAADFAALVNLEAAFAEMEAAAAAAGFASEIISEAGVAEEINALYTAIEVASFASSEYYAQAAAALMVETSIQMALATEATLAALFDNNLVDATVATAMAQFDTEAAAAGFGNLQNMFAYYIAQQFNAAALNLAADFVAEAATLDSNILADNMAIALNMARMSNFFQKMAGVAGVQIAICGVNSFQATADFAGAGADEPACQFPYTEASANYVLSVEAFLEGVAITDANCNAIAIDAETGLDVCTEVKMATFFIAADQWTNKCSEATFDTSLYLALQAAVAAFQAGTGPVVIVLIEETALCSNVQIAEVLAGELEIKALMFLDFRGRSSDTVWGNVRIWDVTDLSNPILISTYYTPCGGVKHFDSNVNDPQGTITGESLGCLSYGAYAPHNVHISGDKAFISWYSDGVVVLNLKDPHNVEVSSQLKVPCPLDENKTSPPDVWGIYKLPGTGGAFVYSDRNCGLGVAQEKGSV